MHAGFLPPLHRSRDIPVCPGAPAAESSPHSRKVFDKNTKTFVRELRDEGFAREILWEFEMKLS
eukprot:1337876-Amorphochlora_amoeboformis.AAC.1